MSEMRLPVCVPMTVGVCYRMTGDGVNAETYEGPYMVEPDETGTVLETNGLLMTDNVVVYPITYSEVGDAENGYTAYINCLPK